MNGFQQVIKINLRYEINIFLLFVQFVKYSINFKEKKGVGE